MTQATSGSASILAASAVSLGTPQESKLAQGVAEEAEVPDTLDLAERPVLAVNALTGAAEGPGNRTSR